MVFTAGKHGPEGHTPLRTTTHSQAGPAGAWQVPGTRTRPPRGPWARACTRRRTGHRHARVSRNNYQTLEYRNKLVIRFFFSFPFFFFFFLWVFFFSFFFFFCYVVFLCFLFLFLFFFFWVSQHILVETKGNAVFFLYKFFFS